MRQTFSGYAWRLSASVSTATHEALRSIGRNSCSFCSLSTTGENIIGNPQRAIPKSAGLFSCLLGLLLLTIQVMNLPTAFANSVKKRPDKIALFWGEREYTYGEFWSQTSWVS